MAGGSDIVRGTCPHVPDTRQMWTSAGHNSGIATFFVKTARVLTYSS
jgi:hypothetical protein